MRTIAGLLALFVLTLFPGLAIANQMHPVSGAYYTSEVDLKVAARGVPMVWERTYRSNRTRMTIEDEENKGYDNVQPIDGPLGFGWHSPFFMRIQKNAAVVSDPIYNTDALVDADGRYIYFPKGPGGIILPDYANGYTLSGGAGAGYTLTQRGGNTWHFDADGLLQSITDPVGRTATLIYSDGKLSGITDAAGRTVFTLTWSNGHVSKVTDLAGRSIQYEYDGSGNLATVKHDADTIFSYSYNANHGLTANRNALGETWSVSYRFPPTQGIAANLTQPVGGSTIQQLEQSMGSTIIKDPTGVTRSQTRDIDGRLLSELDSTGAKSLTVAYLGGGVRTLTDADGNTTKEYRDEWDNVNKKIDAEGGITLFSYNGKGKPTSITDAEGVTTTMSYDTNGVLPTQITRASGTADQTATGFSYAGNGDLQSTTTDGSTTGFIYNPAGLPLTITDPEGGVTTLTYDMVGNLTSSTDASGNKSEYSYDWRGNLLTAKDGEGNVSTYAYNLAGRLQTVTDPLGRVTSTTTDYSGKIASIIAPAGSTSFEYDGNGNLKKLTRADAITTYTYDSQNRLISQTDPEVNITRYGYSNGGGCSTCGGGSSSNSTPTVITDPLGGVTANILDKLGRVKQINDPLSNLTNLQYDKVGRVIKRVDANGNATNYAYDALGRVKSQTDAEGGITSFTYDKKGNLLSLTDPESNSTTFEYDKAGRKTKETRPEGQSTTYTYYPNGLLKTVKDGKGQVTTYTYDKANRLTETQFADSTKHTFQYDKAGNLTNYGTPDVQGAIAYDSANRKTQETVVIGSVTKSYGYSYDSKGNKATFTSPEGVAYSYTYNKNDQPKTITTPVGQIVLDYSWLRNTKVTTPNGVVTDYSYNENNWLTNIAALKQTNPVFTAGYDFDKIGNITRKADTAYGYDKTYQLLNATNPQLTETFTYDKVGNRKTSAATQEAWSYNRNNELLSYNGTTFGYDLNGNTVSKTGSGGTVTYNYGATDRLTSIQLPDGRTAAYAYDPFGRRVKKQVGSEVTYYLYADEGLVGEYGSGGTFRKGYGWKPNGIWGTDPVFMVEGGKYNFYHNDHLGTPQKMTDQIGNVVWSATYSGFGEATVDAGSTVVNNLRFPGQYWDEETGLHWNFKRYYNPTTGRYLKTDPLGLIGGINLFAYTSNNPNILIDPDGQNPGPISPGNGPFKKVNITVGNRIIDNTILGGINTLANLSNFIANAAWPIIEALGSDDMTALSQSTSFPHDDAIVAVFAGLSRTVKLKCKIPNDLWMTLERIVAGEKFPHRNDGSVFKNRPLPGEKVPELPVKPEGYYREFVHPTAGVGGPGAQRVVIGRGGEIYYTPDHYKTFVEVKK